MQVLYYKYNTYISFNCLYALLILATTHQAIRDLFQLTECQFTGDEAFYPILYHCCQEVTCDLPSIRKMLPLAVFVVHVMNVSPACRGIIRLKSLLFEWVYLELPYRPEEGREAMLRDRLTILGAGSGHPVSLS
jgi:hypothetical protein